MSAETDSPLQSTRSRAVVLFAGLLLFCVAGIILPALGLNPTAAWSAGAILLMAFWWITQPIPLWATALIPIPVFPLLVKVPLGPVLSAYFDPVNFLFLGGMLIAACMEQWGLHQRLALGIVSRLGVSPRRIVLGFMLATGFITLWISNTATALLMYPIALAVLKRFEKDRNPNDPSLRRFGSALMLGIAYAASIGGIGTKIGTGPNLIFVKQANSVGVPDVDFLSWLKVGLPIVVLYLPLVWLYLVRVAEPIPAEDFPGGRDAIEDARRRQGVMSRGEWASLIGFLVAAFLWTFRQEMDLGVIRIPGWTTLAPWSWNEILGSHLSQLPAPAVKFFAANATDSQVAMIVGLLLLILPIRIAPFTPALSLRSARRISWDMLILLGGGFALAEGMQKGGLSNAIAQGLKTLPVVHPFLLLLIVCLITAAVSEVASNVATASILLPLLAASSKTLGMHPAPLMLAATMAASFGFMFPAGTPPNAIVFASGYLTVPRMVRSGFLVDLGGALLIAIACYWIAPHALRLQ